MNPNATPIITARIAALVATGIRPVEALRQVVGSDKVDMLIDSLYDELRKKVA